MPAMKLRKVGNSLVVTIPVAVVEQLHLEADMEIEVTAEGGRLVLMPRSPEFEEGLKAYRKMARRYDSSNRELAK